MSLFFRTGYMVAFTLAASAPNLAAAQEIKAGDLVIQHPWARATPGGAEVAGGYLTVVNRGTTPDSLTGGTLDIAERGELHNMTMANGVMQMRPADALAIPPGGSVTLSPMGWHIMFTGLKHPLRKGDAVAGTLTFAHAGTVSVRFDVEGIGAKEPTGAMPGMNMK